MKEPRTEEAGAPCQRRSSPGGQFGNDKIILDRRQKAILSGIKSVFGKDSSSAEAASIEGHADPLFPAPDDVAGQVQPVGLEDQREIVGDAHRAGYLERRSDVRHVANHAIDRAAAELDRSGLQDTMAWEGPLFAHEGVLYAKFISKWLKQGKNYVVLRSFSGISLNLLLVIQAAS
jgi:hypothetical protein